MKKGTKITYKGASTKVIVRFGEGKWNLFGDLGYCIRSEPMLNNLREQDYLCKEILL